MDNIGDPYGVAIDPDRRVLYTPSFGRMIAVALDGSGAHLVPLTGATVDLPAFPSLIMAPVAAGMPRITGSHVPGSPLQCTGARWADDYVSSAAYREPQSFRFGWLRNGVPVSGATGSTLTTVGQAKYQCTVSGTNAAGSRTQSSTTFLSVRNDFRVSPAVLHLRTGTATLKVALPGPGLLTLSGKQMVTRQAEPRKASTVAVLVKARGEAARTLATKGRVTVRAKFRFLPTGGSTSTRTTRITLRTS